MIFFKLEPGALHIVTPGITIVLAFRFDADEGLLPAHNGEGGLEFLAYDEFHLGY